jgi:O-antigen/teichoic acid export membrane protein
VRPKSAALGAVGSQGTQALASFTIQVIVARTLGFEGLGAFAIAYGVMVLVAATASGLIGDSLVVLERRTNRIRWALQSFALAIAIVAAFASFVVGWASGLLDPATAAMFGAAVALFAIEELMRRLLMAGFGFWRVVLIDLTSFAVALGIILAVALGESLSLLAFFTAITVGQAVAVAVGLALLPKEERFLVPPERGGAREVFRYGAWRSGQQFLRPAMLTVVRTLITLLASLAATGLLEAGRVYVAPATLAVSGLSSYLFVSFANDKTRPIGENLRRADRSVLALVSFTVLVGAVLVGALPWAGALLFGTPPDLLAVIGWIGYTASIAAVTPYGALAAVGGRQAAVFGVRAADTVLAIAFAWALLRAGGSVQWVPAVLAAASVLGGLAIRFLILVPLVRRGPGETGQSMETD